MKARLLAIPMAMATALGGCLPTLHVEGGSLTTHDYAPQAKSLFRITSCTHIGDGTPVKPPTATYHFVVLESGKEALYERAWTSGRGAVIDNRWKDNDGTHYFVWVREGASMGYEFVFPPNGPVVRYVYKNAIASIAADGSLRPDVKPFVRCETGP